MVAAGRYGSVERMRAAIERVCGWMNAHEAPLLVDNLAAGASAADSAEAEAALGGPLPDDLRSLWSLHDGQLEDQNGFLEAYDFLSIARARGEQETLLMSIEYARTAPDAWKKTGGTEEELLSNRWVPFATQDSDSLAVCCVTGRVYECPHDDSPRLLAPSLADWLDGYAARVLADDYTVEEGFGDYYLALRDREAERRDAERAEKAAAHARYRRDTPLVDQLQKAVADGDADRCTEVLKDTQDREGGEAFQRAVLALHAGSADPRLVAGALRPLLRGVVLPADAWVDVAVGGALLGNHAIRDVALGHCDGVSGARVKTLEAAVASAPQAERAALEDVLAKVRARSGIPEPAPRSGWLSWLFGKRPPRD